MAGIIRESSDGGVISSGTQLHNTCNHSVTHAQEMLPKNLGQQYATIGSMTACNDC